MDKVEQWVPLLGYAGYSISNMGRVRNDRREAVLTPGKNPNNYKYVWIMQDGVQVNRSLSKLVAVSFLPEPTKPAFNTPIHLDGDPTNCCAENLDWRPRWFAIKHNIQFKKELPSYPDPVRELKTEEIFDDPWAAVFRYGLLYMDLVLSIFNKTYVFPTMQSYEWA